MDQYGSGDGQLAWLSQHTVDAMPVQGPGDRRTPQHSSSPANMNPAVQQGSSEWPSQQDVQRHHTWPGQPVYGSGWIATQHQGSGGSSGAFAQMQGPQRSPSGLQDVYTAGSGNAPPRALLQQQSQHLAPREQATDAMFGGRACSQRGDATAVHFSTSSMPHFPNTAHQANASPFNRSSQRVSFDRSAITNPSVNTMQPLPEDLASGDAARNSLQQLASMPGSQVNLFDAGDATMNTDDEKRLLDAMLEDTGELPGTEDFADPLQALLKGVGQLSGDADGNGGGQDGAPTAAVAANGAAGAGGAQQQNLMQYGNDADAASGSDAGGGDGAASAAAQRKFSKQNPSKSDDTDEDWIPGLHGGDETAATGGIRKRRPGRRTVAGDGDDVRRTRRRESNRASARRSRARKLEEIQRLEQQVYSTEKKLQVRSKELTDARVAQQQLQTSLDAARAQQGAVASQVERLMHSSGGTHPWMFAQLQDVLAQLRSAQ